MEPVTHLLASAAVARGAFDRTRLAMPTALVAGAAVDLDWLAQLAGAAAYLDSYRAATHSLAGATAVAAATALLFWQVGRRHPKKPASLAPLAGVSLAAALAHVLLDVLNPHGVALLWPFRQTRFAWDLAEMVDPLLLAILLLGWLIPTLLRLVTEEIGARAERKGPRRWAAATLILVVLYCGARWYWHGIAVGRLDASVYHGAPPLRVAALPDSPWPLLWRGLAETENTYEEIETPATAGGYFDPSRSMTLFKPEYSLALENAQHSRIVQQYVAVSRFPIARVEPLTESDGFPRGGVRVTVRDLRFGKRSTLVRPVVAIVDLDERNRVVDERLAFADQD
jgi:membrane-bound metal-dependent hydrolase YbcI (DUF457 family)